VLVSPSDAATRDFVERLAPAPGVQLCDDAPGIGSRDLTIVGRIDLDDAVGLEILHVPADAYFEPLWSLAGHGALAALVLHEGSEERPALLDAPARALAALPRVRVVDVVLGARDASAHEGAGSEAREGTGPEVPLFLAGEASPHEAVRALLARVVP
jgi:hypothetical protein